MELLGDQFSVPSLQDHDVFCAAVGLLVDDAGDGVCLFRGGAGCEARYGSRGVHEACCVEFVELGGGGGCGEGMGLEEGEVFGAEEGFPVGVGAVEEVEEWEVGYSIALFRYLGLIAVAFFFGLERGLTLERA